MRSKRREPSAVLIQHAMDWAWLAGIFEGEGYAGCAKSHPPYKELMVAIAQKEITMLAEVQRIAGCGTIHHQRNDKFDIYRWIVTTAKARTFLNKLLPYVRSSHKRAQIERALAQDKAERALGKHQKLGGHRRVYPRVVS